MLYFVRSELIGGPPLPLEQWLELLLKAMEIEVGYEKQGKIIAQGDYAVGKGGCCIYDVESNEELHRLIAKLPTHAFLDWEVIPLLSREKTIEMIKQARASMQKSGK